MSGQPFQGIYLYIDSWRLLVAAFALWMSALVLRLLWRYLHDVRAGVAVERTHPLVYISYTLALVAIATRRYDNLGEPIDWSFWVSTLVVATGLAGLAQRVEFHSPLMKR